MAFKRVPLCMVVTLGQACVPYLPYPPLAPAFRHLHEQPFIYYFFSPVAEARKELEGLAASKKSATSEVAGGDRERQHQAVRVRLERHIAFLKRGVGGPSGLMMAHRNRGMGLPLELVISVKQTGARHSGTGGSIAVSAVFATPPHAAVPVSHHQP